jgi:large subunit ribosomal protein L5
MPIGAKVTLRGERMWEFTERFIATALPRIRDFHGIPNRGFDGRGNYTLGIKDHSIFPELVEASAGHSGMDITFVTSSNDNQAAKSLLEALGMPFAGRA